MNKADTWHLFCKVIRQHLYILYLNKEVKEISTPGPMILCREAKNLGNVKTKLYPLERSFGSFKCKGKRCQVCLNVTEAKHFLIRLLRKSIKLTANLIAMINSLLPYV